MALGLDEAAGLAGREGEMDSRSFAKIFLSMTEVKPARLAESPAFATNNVTARRPIHERALDSRRKSNMFSYIKS